MEFRIEIKTVNTEADSHFKASANIILDETFIIRNAKLFVTRKPFVAMPSLIGRSGKRFSPCHPLTSELHSVLTSAFLDAYREHISENGTDDTAYDDMPEAGYVSSKDSRLGLTVGSEDGYVQEQESVLETQTSDEAHQDSDKEIEQSAKEA